MSTECIGACDVPIRDFIARDVDVNGRMSYQEFYDALSFLTAKIPKLLTKEHFEECVIDKYKECSAALTGQASSEFGNFSVITPQLYTAMSMIVQGKTSFAQVHFKIKIFQILYLLFSCYFESHHQ